MLRILILRRPHLNDADSAKKRKRYLEVFFTTDLRLGAEQILEEYRGRWSIEILIREARESFGLGKDRCRATETIAGANNFRLLIGAAEVLYTAETQEAEKQAADPEERPDRFDRLRPWYERIPEPRTYSISIGASGKSWPKPGLPRKWGSEPLPGSSGKPVPLPTYLQVDSLNKCIGYES